VGVWLNSFESKGRPPFFLFVACGFWIFKPTKIPDTLTLGTLPKDKLRGLLFWDSVGLRSFAGWILFFVAGCLDGLQRKDPSFRVTKGVEFTFTDFLRFHPLSPSSFVEGHQDTKTLAGHQCSFFCPEQTIRHPAIHPFQSFSFDFDTPKFSFSAKSPVRR
jgi:hypothetical protein